MNYRNRVSKLVQSLVNSRRRHPQHLPDYQQCCCGESEKHNVLQCTHLWRPNTKICGQTCFLHKLENMGPSTYHVAFTGTPLKVFWHHYVVPTVLHSLSIAGGFSPSSHSLILTSCFQEKGTRASMLAHGLSHSCMPTPQHPSCHHPTAL